MASNHILITGGAGFIGSNLIAMLRDKQPATNIRILDNESTGNAGAISEFDVEFIKGDIRDKSVVLDALKNVDHVVHLAADTRVIDSIVNPAYNFEVNAQGTFNLLECMRKAGIDKLVNASTGGAILGNVEPPVHENMLPKPTSAYGASKATAEAYCSAYSESYDMNITSLRFSNVYGPRSKHKGSVVAAFFKQVLKKEPCIVYGDGSQTRDYIHTSDLCNGIMLAMHTKTSGVFQLGTGIGTSLNEIMDHMKSIVSPKSLEVVYKDFRVGEIIHNHVDITKAKQQLNFNPSISLIDGLESTWQWLKNTD